MENAVVRNFFEDNAELWILDGYKDDGYNYPVAYHRARIIKKILGSLKKGANIADLGCGGGNVSIMLAELGHSVYGVDQSDKMIEIANSYRSRISPEAQNRVRFFCRPLEENDLEKESFDVALSMGVIGYLSHDETLFNMANYLLKPGGLFLVSCRNRLFNMSSISYRTVNEIRNNEAIKLIEELDELYDTVPVDVANDMIRRLKDVSGELPEKILYDSEKMMSPSEKYKGEQQPPIEPRQHMPKRLKETASKCGFEHKAYYGVHPHLFDPRLNKLLPPQLFNKISNCLEALEHLPISLVWSSVFIGVFQKRD